MRVSQQLATRNQGTRSEQGYMLLAVVVMLALIVVAASAAAPDIAMSIRREREAELIHRGTQYMRAIQRYYKKFGRYPMRIEDLENTNNMRFLRRRYKDPITGKDFRLLHFGEVNMTAITGTGAGAGIMGGAAAAALSGAFGSSAATTPSILGQTSGGLGNASAGTGTFGGTMGSQGASTGAAESGGAFGNQPSGSQGADALAGKVFGGGPIIGVASTSHAASIREFNKKNHYNDWYFIYDPTLDRGGLLRGPAQPPLAGAGGSVVGTPAGAGTNQPGTNSGPGFGNSPSNSPFGNSPLQGPGAMIPAQPQAQPQQ
jgi:type II secretory pathway pseudopilin PulG